jgi:uncharacterized protein YktB (UPF0637 family)
MKKLAIIVLSSLLTASVLPVYADIMQEKEVCAIAANNCLNRVEIIQKRINGLKCQIKDGANKSTVEEMKMLEQKLQDALEQLSRVEES